MRTLNLATDGREQERIKAYLEENASEELAAKINNGTPFTKDGKTLTNKKTLNGFMSFACSEAQKLASKGARSAMVDDQTVFGWAIHYFEEESIEGTLYTLDGSEYKPTPKGVSKPIPKEPAQRKEEPAQQSMFDMLANAEKNQAEEVTEEVVEEQIVNAEETEYTPPEEPKPDTLSKPQESPLYQKYEQYKRQYPDTVVAMRVGDFYEIFGEDAIIAGEKAQLTLTSRDVGLESRIPMVGFPYHAADRYIGLIAEMKHIVIVDEDNVQYFSAPNVTVDTESGEVHDRRALYDDENLIKLLRLIDKVVWRG